MKKNDIAVLVMIAAVTLGITYLIMQALIGNKTSKPVNVESAEAISTDIAEPQASVFNTDGINPTVKIQIGNTTNTQPFGE